MNKTNKDNKNRDNFPSVSIGVIIIITLLLLVPLVGEVRDKIPMFARNGDTDPKTSAVDEESPKKIYKTNVSYIDCSFPDAPDSVIFSVKARNNGEIIFLCSVESGYMGNVLRLMKKSAEVNDYGEEVISTSVSSYIFPQMLLNSVESNDYTYTDFGDDYIFISNNKLCYLIDVAAMKIEKLYRTPKDYNIYQCILSSDREKIAFTADSGLYISDCEFTDVKQLVSTVYALNDTVITSHYPVWGKNDGYIFYKLYVNGGMTGVGRTSTLPGNNRQHTGVGNMLFEFLSGDRIFYHQSSSYATSIENQFICGYLDLETQEMKDKIKSSVYYYEVKTGDHGNFIAALSNNGLLKKLNIIDMHSKKIIYYELFDEIKEFCFSPDETKLLIRAVKDGENVLILVDIYESGTS